MGKEERFECFIDEWDEFDWYIKDNKNNEQFDYLEDITKLLNKQDQRIAELEEQLKNAIVPKFKIEKEVFVIDGKTIRDAVIDEIYWTSCKNCFEYYTRLIYGVNDVQYETIDENEIFATKEEAQAKLEELKGE